MTQTKKKSGYSRQIRRVDPTASASSTAIPAPAKRPKAVSNAPAPVAPVTVSPVAPVAPVAPQPTPPASSSSSTVASAPSTPATPGGPVWEYSSVPISAEDDDDEDEEETWTAFDRITTRLIEGAVTTGRSTTTLNHGAFIAKGGCYLDFGAMEMRENKSNMTVKIRRNPPLSIQIKSPKLDHSGASSNTVTTETKAPAKKKGAKKSEGALSTEETALKKLTNWKEVAAKEIEDKDNCPVCLCALKEDGVVPDGSQSVVRLGKCSGHFFHRGCVLLCYQHSKNQYVRCPICTTIYGVLVGTQPKGTMTSSKSSTSIPGYPKCGTITVHYNFPSGTQGPEHPHPGRHYSGTSRTGYLPDTAEGNEVLRLLKIAFERKLIFRIGQSVTTGADDQVVWNGIHHKTSISGGASNYGYPDETYLERVKDELAQKGVE